MTTTVSLNSRVIASQVQVNYKMDEEVVIFNPESGIYFGLEDVGMRVWELLQEATSAVAICKVLVAEYQVTPQRCEEELLATLQDMADAGLIRVDQ